MILKSRFSVNFTLRRNSGQLRIWPSTTTRDPPLRSPTPRLLPYEHSSEILPTTLVVRWPSLSFKATLLGLRSSNGRHACQTEVDLARTWDPPPPDLVPNPVPSRPVWRARVECWRGGTVHSKEGRGQDKRFDGRFGGREAVRDRSKTRGQARLVSLAGRLRSGCGSGVDTVRLLRLIIDWRRKRLTRPTVCSFQPVPVVPDFADVVASASLSDVLNTRVNCLSGNLRRHFAEPLDASGYGRQPADAVSRGGVPHGRNSRSKPLESAYSVPLPDRNH